MTEKQRENFRKNVKCFLVNKRITQKDLADATGISTTMLAHVVNGDKLPPIDKLFALASYMGVTADQLVNAKLFRA